MGLPVDEGDHPGTTKALSGVGDNLRFIHNSRPIKMNKEQVVSYTRQGFGRSAMITFINGETHQIGSTALQRLRSVLKAEVKCEA